MPRVRPPHDPVRVTIDGETIVAERGEPLAAALLGADKLVVARSPKFHRPRGPSCMRGACDGCLARVDETPNVMTCMVPVREGMAVVSQNRLGPREADLLRMTDWFFPEGLNHHELFAGVPGVRGVMQIFARRVAGLGKLPHEVERPKRAERRSLDVLVVGAGPAGMAVATQLATAGRTVDVIEDQLVPGGGLAALAASDAATFAAIRDPFEKLVASGAIRLRVRTVAGGLYGRDLLVVSPDGAEVIEARSLVLACGAHDGVLAFEGNDVPGVMSARAAGMLLGRGVLVGRRVVVVVPDGGGPYGAAYARAVTAVTKGVTVDVVRGEPVRVRGSSRPRAVVIATADGEKELAADAVLIDAPRSPAYEIAEQAGATLVRESRGFIVKTVDGFIAEGISAVGEMVGTAFEASAIAADAARAAARLASV